MVTFRSFRTSWLLLHEQDMWNVHTLCWTDWNSGIIILCQYVKTTKMKTTTQNYGVHKNSNHWKLYQGTCMLHCYFVSDRNTKNEVTAPDNAQLPVCYTQTSMLTYRLEICTASRCTHIFKSDWDSWWSFSLPKHILSVMLIGLNVISGSCIS